MLKLFILLFFTCSLALAQTLESQFLSYEGRSIKLAAVPEVLKLAQELAQKKGIEYRVLSLKDSAQNSYEALQILPEGRSEQNLEARRVANQMYGLPLIFSPWDLGRSGASAYFHSKGEVLGVSYRFLSQGANDPSYQHELMHAHTYAQLLKGVEMDWAGEVKLLKGERLHTANRDAYHRYAALDELMTTALSAKLESVAMGVLRKKISAQEFNRHEEAEQLLNSLYQSLTAGKYLSLQTTGLVGEALSVNFRDAQFQIGLGNNKKILPATVFLLHSSSREIVNGRGVETPVPEGAQLVLIWTKKPSEVEVWERLKRILAITQKTQNAFLAAEKTIALMVEYPRIEGTNFEQLEKLAPVPFTYFSR